MTASIADVTAPSGLTVEERARLVIGNVWWLRDGETVALSFEEICQVIREFDGADE